MPCSPIYSERAPPPCVCPPLSPTPHLPRAVVTFPPSPIPLPKLAPTHPPTHLPTHPPTHPPTYPPTYPPTNACQEPPRGQRHRVLPVPRRHRGRGRPNPAVHRRDGGALPRWPDAQAAHDGAERLALWQSAGGQGVWAGGGQGGQGAITNLRRCRRHGWRSQLSACPPAAAAPLLLLLLPPQVVVATIAFGMGAFWVPHPSPASLPRPRPAARPERHIACSPPLNRCRTSARTAPAPRPAPPAPQAWTRRMCATSSTSRSPRRWRGTTRWVLPGTEEAVAWGAWAACRLGAASCLLHPPPAPLKWRAAYAAAAGGGAGRPRRRALRVPSVLRQARRAAHRAAVAPRGAPGRQGAVPARVRAAEPGGG